MPVNQRDYQKAMHEAHEALAMIRGQFGHLSQTHPSGPGTTKDSQAKRRALCLNVHNAAVRMVRAMVVAGELVEKREP